MNQFEPDRNRLEELWRVRVTDAKLRLEFAREYVLELQKEMKADGIPAPDGHFAYQQALRSEMNALAEFRRVLQVFRDLTMEGKIPDENQYRRRA